jgi:AcrR family transcriptional regulator
MKIEGPPERAANGNGTPMQDHRSEQLRLSQRHRDIVASLETIFLEEGFRAVTINDLALRLKCSKRTLYEIAPSKQELVLIVMELWLERIRSLGWAGALEHEDPQKRIAAYLQPGVSESRKASPVFLEDLQTFRPALALLEGHQRQRMMVLRGILDDGIKRGRFRKLHAHLVAEMFLVSVTRINEPDFLAAAGMTFSEAFAEFFDLIIHGIVEPKPKGRT